jgi:predicted short-subunit dehydrogenase-like oxidoreductase (DUF2520 family)
MKIKEIVIIGSGNLATNLALALYESGKKIVCVYSRTLVNAKILAEQCESEFTNFLEEIPKTADLYIIAVNDSSIKEISDRLTNLNGIVVHTSGSIPLSVFSNKINNCGVFYPLMTFSKNKKISFKDIPICLEANSVRKLIALQKLANSISKNTLEISSEKRKTLHLAAVFACNFTNLNYSIADDLLQKSSISFDLLKPLIQETARRILSDKPSELQTGPAIRENYEIIQEQVNLLNAMPEYQEVYNILSKLIISIKHKNDEL